MITTTSARVLSRTVARSSRSTRLGFIKSVPSASERQSCIQLSPTKRAYSSSRRSAKDSSKELLYSGIGALLVTAGASSYYFFNTAQQPTIVGAIEKAKSNVGLAPKKEDFQAVYDDIAQLLVEKSEYDDGSYGPVSSLHVSRGVYGIFAQEGGHL